jgi:hypothetical protein
LPLELFVLLASGTANSPSSESSSESSSGTGDCAKGTSVSLKSNSGPDDFCDSCRAKEAEDCAAGDFATGERPTR